MKSKDALLDGRRVDGRVDARVDGGARMSEKNSKCASFYSVSIDETMGQLNFFIFPS